MRFINTNDIEMWAESVDCKYNLPHLIRKLILATLDNNTIKSINFPYGEDVYTGGFDGELMTDSSNIFVPEGLSIWEFGTTNNKRAKADEDYEKRKNNSLGKIPEDTTYININAKKYRDKNKWTEEKKKERFWKDVIYIDSIDIEQWLELAPTVELWLAERLRKPTLGIFTISEYWRNWSENENIKIVPEILLGETRSKETEVIKSFINGNEKVLYVKSITTDEALAFPLAVLKLEDPILQNKAVVIDNRESFNRFVQSGENFIIIAKFKLESIDIGAALHKGHKIIIPISLSDEINKQEKIQLSIVSRENFEAGLKKMGIDSEQARILTKSSGRNISVLKRLLKFDDSTKPKYMESVQIRDILPMLLINRFSENVEGDRLTIEKMCGKTFDEYSQFLRVLATLEDSPVYYLNGTWRLVSPTDIWLYFAKYITQSDLQVFQDICHEVLSEILYKYSLPLETRGNLYQTAGNRTKYSSNLREGLCESIVVISVFGEDYGISSISNVALYVDSIVQKILEMNVMIWRSLSNNLMLLAEASPLVFLSNVERIIKDKSITSFFEVEQGLLHNSNDLAPLLWCLDITAWFPEHLMRVSNALCEILLISPEKFPTSNTPFSNLLSIYRAWYPQTNTRAEDRIKILEILIKRYPDTLYSLLYSLVGNKHDTAFHTPRPKWRLFSELREIHVTQQEVHYMRGFCINNIIEMSQGNIKRILSLIDLLDDMEWDRIDAALQAIETASELEEFDKKKIYHQFRKLIGRHRSYPDAHWSLPSAILDKLEQTALKFKSDDIFNESYLFEEHHPQFLHGRQGSDYTKHGEEIALRRLEFVEKILKYFGIPKIFELATQIQHPYLYGYTLAFSDELTEKDRVYICSQFETGDKSLLSLLQSFLRISENRFGLEPQTVILQHLIEKGFSVQGIVNFLDSLKGSIGLWKFISNLNNDQVEMLYWKAQHGFIYTEGKDELFYALDKLGKFKKSITLLNTLGWAAYSQRDSLTSESILSLLENIPLTEYEDSSQFEHDHFRNILDFLYSQEDYDLERCAKIEMKFIFVFTGGSSYLPKPKNLFKLMSEKPDEYFGFLSQVYLPDDKQLRDAEIQKRENNPNYQEILQAGWEILDSFNVIPSQTADGSLDSEILKKWVTDVRALAEHNHRTRMTDNSIGKLLARYPIDMKEKKGFPIEIYDVIEEVESDEIVNSFRIQISNNLGFTTRGAFEGGNIERFRADYFDSLFQDTKITHPKVSMIFKSLADNYRSDAKWEDENALLRSLD